MSNSKLADIALVLAAGFFAFLFVYSVLNGKPQDFTLLSRIVFAALAVILLLLTRISLNYKAKLVALVYSTVFALFLCEAFLVATSGELQPNRVLQAMAKSAQEQGLPFDTRLKIDVIRDIREAGRRVYPNIAGEEIGSENDKIYFLTGLSETPTVVCNDMGRWIVYETDERGFNNPLGIWDGDHTTLASIGDSFTWGSCVDPDASTPGLLRERFPNSLNLGVAGTGTLKQLAIMREYLVIERPNVVVWFYWEGNDLRGLRSEYQNSALRRYLDPGFTQNLLRDQSDLEAVLRTHLDLAIKNGLKTQGGLGLELRFMFLSRLRVEVRKVWQEKESATCIVPDDVLKAFEKSVKAAKTLVDSWDGELYFVYLPSWTRYSGTGDGSCRGLWNPIYSRDTVMSLAEDAGANTIDISKVFAAHPDPISLFAFRADAHYNEDGYKLVADAVLESIKIP